MQLDAKERGFSFTKEGPLDMRMDPSTKLTAKEIVNKWPERKLGNLFKEYGEEPRWRLAAKAIVRARKHESIETTQQLSKILLSCLGKSRRRRRIHPATLVFQALRIAVNKELEAIQEGISKALHFLSPGGRMGVLSFHSLEDRLVKNIFRTAARPMEYLKKTRDSHYLPLIRLLTKTPLRPSSKECRENYRARSAKLRVIEKM